MTLLAAARRLLTSVALPERRCSIDIETSNEVDLKRRGLDVYVRSPTLRILMIAYAFGFDDVQIWDCTDGSEMPSDLQLALTDPSVILGAYNAHFERRCIAEAWGIIIPPSRFRCTMIRAFSQSFMGTLGEIGRNVGLPDHMQKDKEGERLIRMFSMPQRVTKNQPLVWRDRNTDPADWKLFLEYCRQDVVAEREIWRRLDAYHWPDVEQRYYEIDAEKNDKGLPIDRQFVENGIWMAAKRKAEITAQLKELTGLPNPNSPVQLTKWLKDFGYPFDDVNKNTVKKVIAEHEDGDVPMADDVVAALKMRQQVARTSPKKFDAMLDRAHSDNFMRQSFQFAGASRTNRASGRGAQPHNFPRPPDYLEDEFMLDEVTECVRQGRYDLLSSIVDEPLDAIVGVIRSSFRAPPGKEWVVCDLSSIESVVFGYLAGDQKILDIARNKLDPYRAFAVEWFKIPYDQVTPKQRKQSKVPVLGCAYGMGGGQLREGKRTGLWAYAESLGVRMTKEEANDGVKVWRQTYDRGVQFWYDLDNAIKDVIRGYGKRRVGCVTFDLRKPYLRALLPSGRYMYYHLPRVSVIHDIWPDGQPRRNEQISYMGKNQATGKWERIYSRGAKFAENLTQALARDILYVGMKRAYDAGFDLRLDVHDELGALRDVGDERFSLARLGACMTDSIDYLPGIPLRASGWVGDYYRKD